MSYYYNISLISIPLESFVYFSEVELDLGLEVLVEFRGKKRLAVVLSKTDKPTFKTLKIDSLTDYFFSSNQLQFAKFISSYYISSLGDALSLFVPFKKGINLQNFSYISLKEINLSSKQNEAFSFLKQHQVSLLFGDTGSGKTEIYMKYFQEILEKSKRAIFLMPEISLTPQMEERLREYFNDEVVMWHSRLTPKQKKDRLEKIYSGEAKIIAGARSTLFLPISNLGLIVVDEEHDDSYKSSSRPRYNARDLAIYLAKLYDIPVVLGSATPSLNSYVKFKHFRLKGGYFSSYRDFIYEKDEESLSENIILNLKDIVKRKKQAILFIPTRANFKYLSCKDCGDSIKCVFCSVGMSIHLETNSLRCHYCNFSQVIPKRCPKCNSFNLTSSRIGTAQAVEILKDRLADAKIEQFDKDTITTTRKLKKILKDFNNKDIDILVGTQMLSKGHDYHEVDLAVVIGMDNILNMGDYRAREKALSMVIQVAGRSGRGGDSKVIVQTLNEDFFKMYINDYENFLDDEILFRKDLYPPFKKLCRVLFAHQNGLKAQSQMREMELKLREFKDIEIVSAKKSLIEKISNKYRFEILLRANKITDIIKAVTATKNTLAQIDIDPIEFG